MQPERSEEEKWSSFWSMLSSTNKTVSITRAFFTQLYAFGDSDDERQCSYRIGERRVGGLPESDKYPRDFSNSVFYLDVDSIIPGNDKFRIHVKNTSLDEKGLVLPARDLRLINASYAAFSDWSFIDELLIPTQILHKVTLPLKNLLERLVEKTD